MRVVHAWNLNKIHWEWRKLLHGKEPDRQKKMLQTNKQTDRQTDKVALMYPHKHTFVGYKAKSMHKRINIKNSLICMGMHYVVSILGCAIVGFTHFFQRSCIFFRPMRDVPTLNLNVGHLLFKGQHLSSLKSEKSWFTQPIFFINPIHVHMVVNRS